MFAANKSNKQNAFSLMMTILKLPKKDRSPDDLIFLASYIKDIDFFKQRALNEDTLLEVVNCMSLLEI